VLRPQVPLAPHSTRPAPEDRGIVRKGRPDAKRRSCPERAPSGLTTTFTAPRLGGNLMRMGHAGPVCSLALSVGPRGALAPLQPCPRRSAGLGAISLLRITQLLLVACLTPMGTWGTCLAAPAGPPPTHATVPVPAGAPPSAPVAVPPADEPAAPTLPEPSAEVLSDSERATRLAAEALELKRGGRREEALLKAREAAALDPTNAEAHWIAAWVLAQQGQNAEAIAEFSLFCEVAAGDPRMPAARAAVDRLRAMPAVGEPSLPEVPAPVGVTGSQTAPPGDKAIPVPPPGTTAGSLEGLLAAAPVKGIPERLGGGVMVKFKLRLEDGSEKGLKAVFKPRQKGSQSFTYEIAAYRIDRLCQMGHVPVTAKRALPRSLVEQVGKQGLSRLVFSGDLLGGSAQQWVDDSRDPFGTSSRSWAEKWLKRLHTPGAAIADVNAARQVSDMFLLDYLQGNEDRFSGGNILEDKTGKLWFIDNAEAFGSSSQPRRDLDRVKRFDRKVIDALRKATPKDFAREVGPWLTPAELRALLERRTHVLDHVDAAVKKYGEANVYL